MKTIFMWGWEQTCGDGVETEIICITTSLFNATVLINRVAQKILAIVQC